MGKKEVSVQEAFGFKVGQVIKYSLTSNWQNVHYATISAIHPEASTFQIIVILRGKFKDTGLLQLSEVKPLTKLEELIYG